MISLELLYMHKVDFRPVKILTDLEKKTVLRERHFRDFQLDNVDLAGSDLRNTVFERVSLRLCDFSAADLRHARFINCDLSGARFDGAILDRCQFEEISPSYTFENGERRMLTLGRQLRRPPAPE